MRGKKTASEHDSLALSPTHTSESVKKDRILSFVASLPPETDPHNEVLRLVSREQVAPPEEARPGGQGRRGGERQWENSGESGDVVASSADLDLFRRAPRRGRAPPRPLLGRPPHHLPRRRRPGPPGRNGSGSLPSGQHPRRGAPRRRLHGPRLRLCVFRAVADARGAGRRPRGGGGGGEGRRRRRKGYQRRLRRRRKRLRLGLFFVFFLQLLPRLPRRYRRINFRAGLPVRRLAALQRRQGLGLLETVLPFADSEPSAAVPGGRRRGRKKDERHQQRQGFTVSAFVFIFFFPSFSSFAAENQQDAAKGLHLRALPARLFSR